MVWEEDKLIMTLDKVIKDSKGYRKGSLNINAIGCMKKFLGNKNQKSERDTRQLRPSFSKGKSR